MPDKPVNLNQERKARARVKKRAQADENTVKFGRTKAQKKQDAAEVVAFTSKLDAHKRE